MSYNYVLNNPAGLWDPTGLCPEGVKHGEVWETDSGEQLLCYNEGNDEGVVVEAEREETDLELDGVYQASIGFFLASETGYLVETSRFVRPDGQWYSPTRQKFYTHGSPIFKAVYQNVAPYGPNGSLHMVSQGHFSSTR